MKTSHMISKEFMEDETYWIELAPGFVLRDEWTHAIAEDTKRRAHAKLAEVEPCECKECLGSL